MSREIKFRAWGIDRCRMHDVYNIAFHESYGYKAITSEQPLDLHSTFTKKEEFILMQYTGLKDKNGVEIYEYSELDGAYEVIFKDLRYSLRHIRDNDIIDLHDYWRGKNGEIEVTREYTKV